MPAIHPRSKARIQYSAYMKQLNWGKPSSVKANTYIKRNTEKEVLDMFTRARDERSLVQKAMTKSSNDIRRGKKMATYVLLLRKEIIMAEKKLEEAKQAMILSSANVVNLALQGKISRDKYDKAASDMEQDLDNVYTITEEEDMHTADVPATSPQDQMESDSPSPTRPRGTRGASYKHVDVVNPSEKDFKRKNVIGWHLLNAALLRDNNVLDKFESGNLARTVSHANDTFETKRISDGRGLAQEVIREYLIENGLPVEDKYFVYKTPMTSCLFGADMDPLDLNADLPKNLFKMKTLSSSVIGTLAASIERTYGGCMEGLRLGETKGPHKTRFFFFV